jgi:hypothetical protein
MAYFYVRLDMQIGEFRKTTSHLIEAPDEVNAGRFALANESVGKARFCDEYPNTRFWDAGDQMAYEVTSIREVPFEELSTLCNYMNVYTYCEEEINDILSN